MKLGMMIDLTFKVPNLGEQRTSVHVSMNDEMADRKK